MAQPSYQGRFIWQELLCTDTGTAANFYARILSWKAQPFSPGSPYMVFMSKGGKPLAGAMNLSDEARARGTPAHWRGYVGVGDVDAVLAQALRLGARVVEPAQDMPGVGRVAMLADPEGAIFGLYRPMSDAGGAGDSGFDWSELAARRRETALAFYQQLFGWELRPAMDMGGGMQYQTFGLGGQDFGGCYTIPADRPMPPSWCFYAHSDSADEVAGKVVAGGGTILNGPMTVPGGGRIVQFFDPQHAMFAAHSMPRAAAPQPKPAPKPAPKPKAAASPAAGKSAGKAARKVAKKTARKSVRKAKVKAKATKRPARKTKAKAKTRASKRPARRRSRKPARKK